MIMSMVLSTIPRNMITMVGPSTLWAAIGIPSITHPLSISLRLVSYTSIELAPSHLGSVGTKSGRDRCKNFGC